MGLYEHLLTEAMDGNSLLITREDSVEAAWRVVEPVINNDTPVYENKPGTWEPKEADELIAPHGIWADLEVFISWNITSNFTSCTTKYTMLRS